LAVAEGWKGPSSCEVFEHLDSQPPLSCALYDADARKPSSRAPSRSSHGSLPRFRDLELAGFAAVHALPRRFSESAADQFRQLLDGEAMHPHAASVQPVASPLPLNLRRRAVRQARALRGQRERVDQHEVVIWQL